MSLIQDFTLFELMVISGTVVLLALLVTEVLDVTHFFSQYDKKQCAYGYGEKDGKSINTLCVSAKIILKNRFVGPHLWKLKFPLSVGCCQSPINIISNCAICVPAETIPALAFSPEYHKPPQDMRLYNDGHTGTYHKINK